MPSNKLHSEIIHADVVVVGAGGAGLRAAIAAREVAPDARVIVVTKGVFGQAGTTANACSDRMAFHATLPHTPPAGPNNWRFHAEDIYRIGGQVSDEPLAGVIARQAADAFGYLDRCGVPFAKDADGLPLQFVTDGSKYPRACYVGPDTAIRIEQALVNRADELGIEKIEHAAVNRILSDDSGVTGLAVTFEAGGGALVAAGAVVLATGGAGGIYHTNVFPDGMTGDGYRLAYEAGAELVNLEFIQIGLSSTATKLAASGSCMRAVPRFVTGDGDEFLSRDASVQSLGVPVGELVFRKGASWPTSVEEPTWALDVAVARRLLEGTRVFLDFSTGDAGSELPADIIAWFESKGIDPGAPPYRDNPLERLAAINAPVIEWLREHGVDLAAGDRLELAPAVQHFQGGIKIDERAAATVPGLYAAGECAGGQHGANRPGGNALCDCQVFGRIAGESAVRWARGAGKPRAGSGIRAPHDDRAGSIAASEVLDRVRLLMDRCGGVIRTLRGLRDGIRQIDDLARKGVAEEAAHLIAGVEARSALVVARMVLAAAERRRESRGPHLMFGDAGDAAPLPRDDSRWQKYIVIRKANGRMCLDVRRPRSGRGTSEAAP